jgi:hypothetical protein
MRGNTPFSEVKNMYEKQKLENMNDTLLGGYAEKTSDNTVAIRGFYGRRIVVPMDELDALVAEFNEEVWNGTEDITLRQITGSGGPSDKLCIFYMEKHNIDPRTWV